MAQVKAIAPDGTEHLMTEMGAENHRRIMENQGERWRYVVLDNDGNAKGEKSSSGKSKLPGMVNDAEKENLQKENELLKSQLAESAGKTDPEKELVLSENESLKLQLQELQLNLEIAQEERNKLVNGSNEQNKA